MKHSLLIYGVTLILLNACQNKNSTDVKMSTHYTSDSTMCCQVPSYMKETVKKQEYLQFQGNKKIIEITKKNILKSEDLKKFAQYSIGKNSSKLTLTEYNDTLIVYEIKKGIITLPAHIFSLHERNGYSILIATFGISLPTHNIISKSITCKTANSSNTTTLFDGEYINLSYPSNWIVDKHPKSLLADIYIGEKDHSWGTWIFRFEHVDRINFRQMMSEIENSYKEQGVLINLIYEQINGIEWCKQDIQMNIQGNICRQISYYCQNKNYTYNVKFGLNPFEIQKNQATIDSIMSSIKIK